MSAAAKHDIRCWKALKPISQGRYDHGCCKIDDHRMIILGGRNAYAKTLSSGMIYDVRTELWTPLPNDMPKSLRDFGIAGNDKYVFIIGGESPGRLSKAVYRLSLETFEWTTMAPMDTVRNRFAAVRKGDYIYVFGGSGNGCILKSVERYSILNNAWEHLPDTEEGRYDHCAVAGSGSAIYIVGGDNINSSLEIFDTTPLLWKIAGTPREIPGKKYAVTVLLKDQYLVMIGRLDEYECVTADCLIYDIWSKHWSVTPPSVDILKPRADDLTAAVLDGKIVIVGGLGCEPDSEFIYINDLLEYAPLHYPLPSLVLIKYLRLGELMMIEVARMIIYAKRLRSFKQIAQCDIYKLEFII